jgi:uncharacterized oligopeptide transporter (OPT) family protein
VSTARRAGLEFTLRAAVAGVLLGGAFGAADTYLGLRRGASRDNR